MRVFVNNVDGHLAGAICADLSKLTSEIIGTRKGHIDELVPPPSTLQQVVPRFEVRQLLKTIAACDVVVYDLHDADFEELEVVLRVLYQSEIIQEMTFIIISSVGVWARTPCEYEEMQELIPEISDTLEAEDVASAEAAEAAGEVPAEADGEEQLQDTSKTDVVRAPTRPRPRSLKSEDYIRRVPAPKFQEWKTIETLTLALKEKGAIRPYVVCAGMPYGNGEDAFLGLFRAAWMGLPTLRVIGHGHNSVPLVHARDVARLVRHVVKEQPELSYHLAVDRGDVTQRAIVEAVAHEFGMPGDVRSVSIPEALLAEMADMLMLDLRFEPSPLMQAPPPQVETAADTREGDCAASEGGASPKTSGDGEGDDVADDTTPEPTRRTPFRWWCEGGLPANVATVAAEFRRWRRLQPVRLCVVGPPGSAAALLGATVAARYNLPHFAIDSLVEEARNADTETGAMLREKLSEIEAALANPKASGPFLLPSNILAKVVEDAISSRACLYRGFVLSGFPQCLEDAAQLFLEDQIVADEGVEKDKKATKKDDGPKVVQVPREAMLMDGIAIVSCTEEQAMARLSTGDQPEEQWLPSFKRKMERWQKENADGSLGLSDFFQTKLSRTPLVVVEPEAPVTTEQVDAVESEKHTDTETVEQAIEVAACTLLASIEAVKEVNNFMPPLPGPCSAHRDGDDKESPAVGDNTKKFEEEETRHKKDLEEKLEQIKKDELSKLEKHSEPLRQYLMSFVVPTVTSGLIEVCRTQPEDPAGYLAEYLATYSHMSRKRSRSAKTMTPPAGGAPSASPGLPGGSMVA